MISLSDIAENPYNLCIDKNGDIYVFDWNKIDDEKYINKLGRECPKCKQLYIVWTWSIVNQSVCCKCRNRMDI